MRYFHRFHIQASHVNTQTSYQTLWDLINADTDVPNDAALDCLRDVHGHNFCIDVTMIGDMAEADWLVDDIALAKIVNQWDNQNLSTLDEFTLNKIRATTERMAEIMCQKIRIIVPDTIMVIVRVWETDDIYAECASPSRRERMEQT